MKLFLLREWRGRWQWLRNEWSNEQHLKHTSGTDLNICRKHRTVTWMIKTGVSVRSREVQHGRKTLDANLKDELGGGAGWSSVYRAGESS